MKCRVGCRQPVTSRSLITTFDGISVGEDWEQRLYRELREVDAVIGVVTSSFVASNWCSAELGIADALGCRLMPLRAEAGVVHPLMKDLQHADHQADPQQAHEHVLQAVRLLHDGGGRWREGNNPFPGLEPFTAALSRVFFGRAAEAREVGNRLRTMAATGGVRRSEEHKSELQAIQSLGF